MEMGAPGSEEELGLFEPNSKENPDSFPSAPTHRDPSSGLRPRHLLDVLMDGGQLDEANLEEDLRLLSREDDRAFGEALVQRGILTREDLARAWAELMAIPFWPQLEARGVDGQVISQIPIHFARKHHLVPVKQENGDLWVAIADPLGLEPLDALRVRTGMRIRPVISLKEEILRTINRVYHESADSAEQVLADLEEVGAGRPLAELEESEDLLESSADAPVIKLVNTILSEAVRVRASDIHIEPYQKELKIRYRVDGVLYNSITPSRHLHSAIVSRIKVMAKMNIAEKRLPQDGRIRLKVADRDFDIRVSTLPTSFGERVVLRLLDKTSVLLGLEEVGLTPEQMELFEKLITAPNGIILVTGPTGSGKTTTLYAALNRINSPDKNIITIEDPVEYQLPGIGQIQVNNKIGLTFAKGLRSIVRQDPDVILVGEIRDTETAEISIHAALTGHLVFSTLHTNDAAGAITRLIDMGIEPFLVSSSVNAILAQRLVRVICPKCKEPYKPNLRTLKELGVEGEDEEVILYRGRGCEACLNTGYRGRTGIFEFLVVDDTLRGLILQTSDAATIKRAAMKSGMRTLREDGIRKVRMGITTIEEVLRVTGE
jgi:general secretion pathway protein E